MPEVRTAQTPVWRCLASIQHLNTHSNTKHLTLLPSQTQSSDGYVQDVVSSLESAYPMWLDSFLWTLFFGLFSLDSFLWTLFFGLFSLDSFLVSPELQPHHLIASSHCIVLSRTEHHERDILERETICLFAGMPYASINPQKRVVYITVFKTPTGNKYSTSLDPSQAVVLEVEL